MRTTKQKITITLSVLLVFFVIASATFYYYRDELLQKAIAQVTKKLDTKYNSVFTLKEAHFEGISAVSMSEVSLVPRNQDTLFHVKKMETSVSLTNLMIGDVQLGSLKVNDGFVQLVKNENGKNYSAFLSSKGKKETTPSSERKDYAKIAYRLITKA